MPPEVTDDAAGKRVLDGDGDSVGVVDDVRDGTAYVDPDADVEPTLKSKLGWGRDEQKTYPLRHDAIAEITDEGIRLGDEYR